MSKLQRICAILTRMNELARLGESTDVSTSLEHAIALIKRDSQEGVSAILSMYGGMGSLNDTILYKDNKLLVTENEEFDTLRSDLFDLCIELRN